MIAKIVYSGISYKLVKKGFKKMITLVQRGNDYYLNGVKGDYSSFNYNGKHEQISYSVAIEDGQTVRTWRFKD